MTELTPEQEREVVEFTLKQCSHLVSCKESEKNARGTIDLAIEMAKEHGMREANRAAIIAGMRGPETKGRGVAVALTVIIMTALAKLATMGIGEETS